MGIFGFSMEVGVGKDSFKAAKTHIKGPSETLKISLKHIF